MNTFKCQITFFESIQKLTIRFSNVQNRLQWIKDEWKRIHKLHEFIWMFTSFKYLNLIRVLENSLNLLFSFLSCSHSFCEKFCFSISASALASLFSKSRILPRKKDFITRVISPDPGVPFILKIKTFLLKKMREIHSWNAQTTSISKTLKKKHCTI